MKKKEEKWSLILQSHDMRFKGNPTSLQLVKALSSALASILVTWPPNFVEKVLYELREKIYNKKISLAQTDEHTEYTK